MRTALPFAVVLAVAAALRAPLVGAALPYFSYIDEGHILHRVVQILALRDWDTRWYLYPPLLIDLIALVALGWPPLREPAARAALAATQTSPFYDVVEPTTVLVLGRVVVLLFSVATVALIGRLGARLVDRRVGVTAACLAAVLPAFVVRSAIVTVDVPATCLVTAALCAATGLARAPSPGGAILAGVAAGLAATAKYPSGLVLLAVLVVLAAGPAPRRARAAGAAAAVAAAGLVFVVVLPDAVLRTAAVVAQVGNQGAVYRRYGATPGLLPQATAWLELGPVFLALAAAGTLVLLADARARLVTLGWLVFAAALLAVLLQHEFQPFRNLLPLVPFTCVAAAAAIVRFARLVAGRWEALAGAALAAVLAALLLVRGVRPQVARAGSGDSRVMAREWLETHVRAGEPVVVAAEIAFLPGELARLGDGVVVRSWEEIARGGKDAAQRWVVAPGAFERSPRTLRDAWGDPAPWRLVLDVGATPTPLTPDLWRGNWQRIVVYRAQ
jgi:hypothetical protein